MKLTVDTRPLVGKLQHLSKEVKAAIRKGSRAGCKRIAEASKQNTPVKTGAAKRSIKVRALPRSRRWIGAQVRSGMPARHFSFLELGTAKMDAREPMRQAVEGAGAGAGDTVVAAVLGVLK